MIYSATVEVSRFVHIERNNGICFLGAGGGGRWGMEVFYSPGRSNPKLKLSRGLEPALTLIRLRE